jgi:hypothetical protein
MHAAVVVTEIFRENAALIDRVDRSMVADLGARLSKSGRNAGLLKALGAPRMVSSACYHYVTYGMKLSYSTNRRAVNRFPSSKRSY